MEGLYGKFGHCILVVLKTVPPDPITRRVGALLADGLPNQKGGRNGQSGTQQSIIAPDRHRTDA